MLMYFVCTAKTHKHKAIHAAEYELNFNIITKSPSAEGDWLFQLIADFTEYDSVKLICEVSCTKIIQMGSIVKILSVV